MKYQPTFLREIVDLSRFAQRLKSNRERDYKPASEKYNILATEKHLYNEIIQSFKNYAVIDKCFKDGTALDLGDIPKVKEEPLLLMGSGPSFDLAAPLLKDWHGDVMTSTSQAVTCVYLGKPPKYIMALDPDCERQELELDRSWVECDTTLIHHPGVNNKLVGWWPGRRALFRKLEPKTPFYREAQKIGYSEIHRDDMKRVIKSGTRRLVIAPKIRSEIITMGCAVNAQLFAAVKLGHSPIYLVGVDFGYPMGQARFTRHKYVRRQWVTEADELKNYTAEGMAGMVSNNGVPTNPIHLWYKTLFLASWRIERCNVVNCSVGTLTEPPFAPIKEVIACQGDLSKLKKGKVVKPFTEEKIIKVTEKYLLEHGTFIPRFKMEGGKHGIQIVNFNEPEEIPPCLKRMLQLSASLDYAGTIKALKETARKADLDSSIKEKIIAFKTEPGV